MCLHFRKTWFFIIFMICFHPCFSIDWFCLWHRTWMHYGIIFGIIFKFLGVRIGDDFWFDIFNYRYGFYIKNGSGFASKSVRGGVAGRRLLSPSRSRAIFIMFEWVSIVFDPFFGPLRRQNGFQIVKDIIDFLFISMRITISDDQDIWAHIENKIITEAGPNIELCSTPAPQTTCS